MASLAEHLSGPPVEVASAAPLAAMAKLAPIGLFCMSVGLFVFSCSVLAYFRVMPDRR